MSPAAWTFIGTVVAAIAGVIGGYLIKRIDAKTTRTLTPYEALAQRVTTLEVADGEKEAQISDLRGKLNAVIEDRDGVVSYLKTLWRWVISGSKPPPPPIPDHLHDILPPTDYVWPTPPQTFDDTTD